MKVNNVELRLISRSSHRLSLLEDALSSSESFRIKRRLVSKVDRSCIKDGDQVDVLILDLSEDWNNELLALGELRRQSDRSPTIVVAPDDNTLILKMAMKAGARDYLAHPLNTEELIAAVHQVSNENRSKEISESTINIVLNAKGGSGSSFLASNIAHILANERRKEHTVLIDMNFITAELPLYLDLSRSGDIREAIDYCENLDEIALQSFIMEHRSGLHLLAANQNPSDAYWIEDPQKFEHFVSLLSSLYSQIVVDLPNPISSLSSPLLYRADNIFLVAQQNVMAMHCTKRLLDIIDAREIPREKVCIVINRYDSKNSVRIEDFVEVNSGINTICVPNDYKRASESMNLGIPLAEKWNKAPVTQAIRGICLKILGINPHENHIIIQSLRKLVGFR